MKEASYLIDYGDLLARFCLSFVFLWSGFGAATITETCWRTSPAAIAGGRSYCPPAQRYSTDTFWPSM
jgi:hypothetical protein